MRGSVIMGRIDGWYGVDCLVKMLRQEGMQVNVTKPYPQGAWSLQVSEDVILTFTGCPNDHYVFSITINADADVVERLRQRLSSPTADVNVYEPYMMEVSYRPKP